MSAFFKGYVYGCRVGMPLGCAASAEYASFHALATGSALFFVCFLGSFLAWRFDLSLLDGGGTPQ